MRRVEPAGPGGAPPSRRSALAAACSLALGLALGLLTAPAARADALDALRSFVREARTGSAEFTQTVIAPDGARRRNSSGSFEFSRPGRFRFAYTRPSEQLIVADGQRLWVHDVDLNQVISRRQAGALAATPAALLAGGSLEQDFSLANDGSSEGLDWVLAKPRSRDAGFESLRIGFRGRELAAVEILDSLGQKSVLRFTSLRLNLPLPVERFVFQPPKGADVISQ